MDRAQANPISMVYSKLASLNRSYPLGIPKAVMVNLFKSADRLLADAGNQPPTLETTVKRRFCIISLAADAKIKKDIIVAAAMDAWGDDWKTLLKLKKFESCGGCEPLTDRLEPRELGEKLASTAPVVLRNPQVSAEGKSGEGSKD